MRRVFILLLFFHILATAWCQQQGAVWHFGNKLGLDFTSGVPVEITDSQMRTYEGCASISDCEGNLLFYTNGGGRLPGNGNPGMIWNRNHEVMYDMQGMEGGGWSAGQSSIIFKKPGNNNAYYLFTMEESQFYIDGNIPGQPFGRGLSYFEIDMDLNGGLGGVTVADERVFVPSYESLTACLHANQEDYWVVITTEEAEFAVFQVTENGVQDTTFYQAPNVVTFGAANLKFSPDRTKLYAGGYIFDFDASTGEISNGIFLNAGTYGSSFSKNSRYLYTNSSTLSEIIRYDTEASNIAASATVVGFLNSTFPLIGAFQLAPDGNIYIIVTTSNSVVQIFQIKDPDGMDVSVEGPLFSFPNQGQGAFGLPNFTDHLFALEQVELEVPSTLIGGEMIMCPDETYTLDAENTGASFYWSTGSTAQSIEVTEPGTYTVAISNGCSEVTGVVTFLPPTDMTPELIASKLEFCPGEEITIEVATNLPADSQMEWSTGEMNVARIHVSQSGLYTCTVHDECGQPYSASIEVTLIDEAPTLTLETTQETMCLGEDVQLTAYASNATDIYWEMDPENTEMSIEEPGTYYAFAENACFVTEASMTIDQDEFCDLCLEIPNIFTPNRDNINDAFQPLVNCPPLEYHLAIFNRFGQQVFDSSDPAQAWDGTYKGKPMPTDVYLYRLEVEFAYHSEPVQVTQGELTLIR